MKRLFLLAIIASWLTACSNDPVFHGMTTQQKETYSKAVAGEYQGTYVIIYNDDTDDDTAVKVEGSQVTITDQTMHAVLFHNYPVSMLSHIVADPALADALAGAPNVDFLADYHFYDLQAGGDVSWGFEPAAIPLTLHYGGADHYLTLKLSNGSAYYRLTKASIDSGSPFSGKQVLNFSVAAIYEGDTLLQDFDGVWQDNDHYYITYFQMDE